MGGQLEKARQKLEQYKTRIRDLETAEKKKARKIDARKKVLMGAYLQHWMDHDEKAREHWEKTFAGFLTRDVDRELFGFNKKGEAQAKSDDAPQDAVA